MKVRRVWLRGLVLFLFLASLTFGTAHAQNGYPDLSIWEGKLFGLVETKIGFDFDGIKVVSSPSIIKKLLYIPKPTPAADLVGGTLPAPQPVLCGLLYVPEGKRWRFDRFIDLQFLGGTALDFYGNSFAYLPDVNGFKGDFLLVRGVEDQAVFRLTGKIKKGCLIAATFVTAGGIFNECPYDANEQLNENFEPIRAGGLSYVGALIPDLLAKPIISCLLEPPPPPAPPSP